MKRSGKTAGDDFADNRVPGKGQKRARKSLTDGTELNNQGTTTAPCFRPKGSHAKILPG